MRPPWVLAPAVPLPPPPVSVVAIQAVASPPSITADIHSNPRHRPVAARTFARDSPPPCCGRARHGGVGVRSPSAFSPVTPQWRAPCSRRPLNITPVTATAKHAPLYNNTRQPPAAPPPLCAWRTGDPLPHPPPPCRCEYRAAGVFCTTSPGLYSQGLLACKICEGPAAPKPLPIFCDCALELFCLCVLKLRGPAARHTRRPGTCVFVNLHFRRKLGAKGCERSMISECSGQQRQVGNPASARSNARR